MPPSPNIPYWSEHYIGNFQFAPCNRKYQKLELQPSERFGTPISINYMKLFYLDLLPNLIHVTFLKSYKNISPAPFKRRIVFSLTLGQCIECRYDRNLKVGHENSTFLLLIYLLVDLFVSSLQMIRHSNFWENSSITTYRNLFNYAQSVELFAILLTVVRIGSLRTKCSCRHLITLMGQMASRS